MLKRFTLRTCLTLALVWSFVAGTARGQVTLFQDFDSGSLDLSKSSVNMSNPSAPAITLDARNTKPNDGGGEAWWWVYFRAEGVQGRTPQFRIGTAVSGIKSYHRWVYSYDRTTWSYFDNGSVSGTTYRFSNAAAFAQDQVYVAVMFPYPMSRTHSHVASVKASPYVHPTVSGTAGLVVGRTPGTAGGDRLGQPYYDELGRTIPAQDLYGFKITDASATGPKTKIAVICGNHSGETLSHYALEGLVGALISDDPKMARLRRQTEFYIYPQVDPEGRLMGFYRTSPINPLGNHNRRWSDDPQNNLEIETIESALRADTGGTVDYFLDFHSMWDGSQGAGYPLFNTPLYNSDFSQNLQARDPDFGWGTRRYDFHDGYAQGWAEKSPSAGGLGAYYSGTPEFGMLPGTPIERYEEIGANFAWAFYDTIVPEPTALALLGLGVLLTRRRRR
ncbi:MAG: M14-type cytosolic carboxypeptidase [Planctomycetota bacterium]|jgi:hypothetical protein